jgi:hypothetical protein
LRTLVKVNQGLAITMSHFSLAGDAGKCLKNGILWRPPEKTPLKKKVRFSRERLRISGLDFFWYNPPERATASLKPYPWICSRCREKWKKRVFLGVHINTKRDYLRRSRPYHHRHSFLSQISVEIELYGSELS